MSTRNLQTMFSHLESHGGPLIVVPGVASVVEHVVEDAGAAQHFAPWPIRHPCYRRKREVVQLS